MPTKTTTAGTSAAKFAALNPYHLTLDGVPLCEQSGIPAYRPRVEAAGSAGLPCACSHPTLDDGVKAAARLAEQFPGRVALLFKPCPWMLDYLTKQEK